MTNSCPDIDTFDALRLCPEALKLAESGDAFQHQ
ncbi:hypothetical protein P3T16_005224 [Paraburkholderia sp. GAS42]|jgi:hypothetical protein